MKAKKKKGKKATWKKIIKTLQNPPHDAPPEQWFERAAVLVQFRPSKSGLPKTAFFKSLRAYLEKWYPEMRLP